MENAENDMAWYRLYFKDKGLFFLFRHCEFAPTGTDVTLFVEHENFICTDNDDDPFVLSIIRELDMRSSGKFMQYRAIVWLKTVWIFIVITMDDCFPPLADH